MDENRYDCVRIRHSKSVLFVSPDSVISASTRYRAVQIADELVKRGWKVQLLTFQNNFGYKLIHSKGYIVKKFLYVLSRLLAYAIQILKQGSRADIIVIHRSCLPFGPPLFEWVFVSLFHRPVIFDFDDAVFINVVTRENPFIGYFKMNPFRTNWAIRNADAVIAGSFVLKEYALSLNRRVFLIPTATHHCPSCPQSKNKGHRIIIGWVGSPGTSQYLRGVREVLERVLEKRPNVEVHIIGARPKDIVLHSRCKSITWRLDEADKYFCNIDIGINPIKEDEFSRAKCAFKVIQYMAHGIPTVASPVGMNSSVIDHGITGFLANNKDEWEKYLLTLVDNAELRKLMGERAKEKMINFYSTNAVVSAFEKVLIMCLRNK